MDLTEYRSQFDLHFLVPYTEDFQEVKLDLRAKGHSVFHSSSLPDFMDEFDKCPSHLVIADITLISSDIESFLAEILDKAAQTNFILIGSSFSRFKYLEYREYGVLDFIAREDHMVSAIQWSIENALERVILKLLNKNVVTENSALKEQAELNKGSSLAKSEENLLLDSRLATVTEGFIEDQGAAAARAGAPIASVTPMMGQGGESEEDLSQLIAHYENTRNREDLLQVFFHSLEAFCTEGSKVLYFKYLEPVQLLVATHGVGIPVEDIKGAGVRLTPEEVLEARILMRSPRGFGSLTKLLDDVFHVKQCYVKPLIIREDIDGLFVFFGSGLDEFNTIHFNNRFALFKMSFERFSFLKRQLELELDGVLENICPFDEFFELLSERLDQLKRHQMGLAVLRISIDRLHFIEEKFGPTAVNSVIRALAVTIKKYTRSGDLLRRTALNEFSLLATHLKPQEATVLAERIRQALENLDIPPVTGSLSISLGVSTYPQLATSAESLMKGALQALSAAMGQGGNRVGIARAVRSSKIARLTDTLDQETY